MLNILNVNSSIQNMDFRVPVQVTLRGRKEINTTNWSPGLYLFQLRHHERLIESIRFEVIR